MRFSFIARHRSKEKYEERHTIGTPARTCYALGFWLGNRRGDIANLEWDDLVTEEIELFDGSLELEEPKSPWRKGDVHTGR
ncbi:hypothetical protein MesoLj113c_27930 [Mesorhizobium sp. 113-3-9]|uniref:hypothetical protein n=1 Tax=Mesorhizobium sp. 113-3-9 TaxID=2744517 RepID=UPI001937B3EB|nr:MULTISPECIES: hypothetical protein [unclassified Mesorhizobium]BCG86683.1 hypothetical protein MesoLj113c_27930 [Mesorhizobium sp. 113-3-9]